MIALEIWSHHGRHEAQGHSNIRSASTRIGQIHNQPRQQVAGMGMIVVKM